MNDRLIIRALLHIVTTLERMEANIMANASDLAADVSAIQASLGNVQTAVDALIAAHSSGINPADLDPVHAALGIIATDLQAVADKATPRRPRRRRRAPARARGALPQPRRTRFEADGVKKCLRCGGQESRWTREGGFRKVSRKTEWPSPVAARRGGDSCIVVATAVLRIKISSPGCLRKSAFANHAATRQKHAET